MGYITPSTYPSFGRAVRLYYEERNVNTAANTSDIYWELQGYNRQPDATGYYDAGPFNVTINGVKVVNNLYPSGSRIQLREDTVVARGTLANVVHDSDGSKSVTASFSCDYIYDATNKASGSDSIPLTTIPRASTLSVPDGIFGSAWTVTVSSAVATFTNEVTVSIGAHTATQTRTGGGGITFTAATTRTWADAAPTSDSATVTVTCVTKNGGTTIGTTTATATFIVPESWKPSILQPTTVAGVNTFGGLTLQNVSSANIRVRYQASQGATLTSLKVTGPNLNTTVPSPSANELVPTGTLTTSGAKTWTIIVTDSRGRQATQTSPSLTVTPYSLPTIKLTARRCDSGGTANDLGNYMTATADCSFDTSIANNKAGVTVKMTSSGGTTTTLGTLTNQSAAFTYTTPVTAASSTDTFLVEATITDSVGSSVTVSTRLSTAQVLMDFKAGGDGIAFGGSATDATTVAFKNWAMLVNNHRQYPGIQLQCTDQSSIGGWVWLATKLVNSLYAGARMAFSDYSYDSSSGAQLSTYETYRLPEVDPDLASSANYEILTEKTAATTGTWSPTINWSDGSSVTTSGTVAKYQKFGKMIHYFGYFNITNLGSTGNKYLRVTLPHTVLAGENGAGPRLEAATPPANSLLIWLRGSYFQVVYGPGAGYTRAQMSTGWHSFDFWAMEA